MRGEFHREGYHGAPARGIRQGSSGFVLYARTRTRRAFVYARVNSRTLAKQPLGRAVLNGIEPFVGRTGIGTHARTCTSEDWATPHSITRRVAEQINRLSTHWIFRCNSQEGSCNCYATGGRFFCPWSFSAGKTNVNCR